MPLNPLLKESSNSVIETDRNKITRPDFYGGYQSQERPREMHRQRDRPPQSSHYSHENQPQSTNLYNRSRSPPASEHRRSGYDHRREYNREPSVSHNHQINVVPNRFNQTPRNPPRSQNSYRDPMVNPRSRHQSPQTGNNFYENDPYSIENRRSRLSRY